MDYEYDAERGFYLQDDDLDQASGPTSGAGGIPGAAGTTTVESGGTGIGRGQGGNIPSYAERKKKKKRLLAGNGTPAERRKEEGGFSESVGLNGY